jgi:hypothetical protein
MTRVSFAQDDSGDTVAIPADQRAKTAVLVKIGRQFIKAKRYLTQFPSLVRHLYGGDDTPESDNAHACAFTV